MDWNSLKQEIAEAAYKAFRDLLESRKDESFYVFCLYTDDGAMTVMPAANSEQALSEALAKRPGASSGFQASCRWSPAEWQYEASGEEYFTEICAKLAGAVKRQGIARFRKDLISTMIDALNLVKDRLHLEAKGNRVLPIYFVSVSDDDSSLTIENSSALEINGESAGVFITRFD